MNDAQKFDVFLRDLIDKRKYSEFLIKNWIDKKTNILDFSYFGLSFRIGCYLDILTNKVSIYVENKKFDICSFFKSKSKRIVLIESLDFLLFENYMCIILDFIFDKFKNDIELLRKLTSELFLRNQELESSLKIFSRNLNYHFGKWFFNNDIYDEARSITQSSEYKGCLYKKRFKDRPFGFSGLTKKQAFLLELICLVKINKNKKLGKIVHFPNLVSFDKEKFTIVMSNNGIALNELRSPIYVRDIDIQCENIVNVLIESNVIHLDDHLSGKNILVDNNGIISLIDFDISVVDNCVFSLFFENRLKRFYEKGGYDGFLKRMKKIIRSSQFIIE